MLQYDLFFSDLNHVPSTKNYSPQLSYFYWAKTLRKYDDFRGNFWPMM